MAASGKRLDADSLLVTGAKAEARQDRAARTV